MKRMRDAIGEGTFKSFREDFYKKRMPTGEA
jgi:queuine/archaeosine tRNA-ribosyltransferase